MTGLSEAGDGTEVLPRDTFLQTQCHKPGGQSATLPPNPMATAA